MSDPDDNQAVVVAEPMPTTDSVASSAEPAISATNLCKTYRSGTIFRKRFEALKNVSFEVKQGEVFGLLGPNGAGKTTFVKILLGIISKTAGSASLLGCKAGSIAARRQVGYLPEHLRISPHLTAWTALECFGNLSNVPNSVIRDKRDELLDLVGLTGRHREPVKNFSKGMLQRLGLAQAMLHDPRLLMLDEPTDGLDPRARAEMRQIIHRLRELGVTIFLNSHLLQEVELICDSVAILNLGQLKYCGPVDTIGQEVANENQQINAEVDLCAPLEEIEAALQGRTFKHLKPPTKTIASIDIEFSYQGEVDQFVDEMRKRQISILRLLPRRISLEDAFLKLIDDL